MITRPKECIGPDGLVLVAALTSVIAEHHKATERMARAKAYYDGVHDVTKRMRTDGLPNNRLVHNFPRYITTMASGYLIGNPVSYAVTDEEAQKEPLDGLLDAYDRMSADSVDAELAKHASIYGKGVEIAFADEGAAPRAATVDPREAFVVYDDTVEHAPLFGVRYYKRTDVVGLTETYRVYVHTEKLWYGYDGASLIGFPAIPTLPPQSHYFGGVPMVEYWNSDDEVGDFDPVMSLIDAYNTLESDRINDKEQFVDAILLVTGAQLDRNATDPDDKRTPAQRLREDKLIELIEPEARAAWLTKQLDEGNTEVLKDALKADIHKMSLVPDLTDEQFAGNSSGVAMRYKLMGLEQLTKIKERWFREALRSRMRLFAHYLTVKGGPVLDVDRVQITFTRALPTNDLEIAQMVQMLVGIVPDEILLTQMPFVSDAEAALEMLKEQKQEAAREREAMFAQYPDANAREAGSEEA